MKKQLLLCFILAIGLYARCQENIKVDSILWIKGQTVYCRGRELKTGAVYFFPLNFRGMGKRPEIIGQCVTKKHNVKKRRSKNDFIFKLNN